MKSINSSEARAPALAEFQQDSRPSDCGDGFHKPGAAQRSVAQPGIGNPEPGRMGRPDGPIVGPQPLGCFRRHHGLDLGNGRRDGINDEIHDGLDETSGEPLGGHVATDFQQSETDKLAPVASVARKQS